HNFDFKIFKKSIENLNPEIVYYMYSGLSDKGDANGGRDLAEFVKWCRNRGIVTIVDSHTLTGNPQQLIDAGQPVEEYKLLDPLLSELDLFFTSSDEAKMIQNTLGQKKDYHNMNEHQMCSDFLNFLSEKYWTNDSRSKLLGVTVSSGAYIKYVLRGNQFGPAKVQSRFMAGEVTDLVGAGDSFRAGFISYIAGNLKDFKSGTINFEEAVQMGNLFASLYIKSPLDDRYANIKSFDKMLTVVRSDKDFENFKSLQKALK
ncbi:MAG TPA: PfkB family carbohydrate kinase, partial [Sedimentisphaerales bacterium]|nr:PfkB family carbohydrate kinase [Sedimentisphaerales bacterium]